MKSFKYSLLAATILGISACGGGSGTGSSGSGGPVSQGDPITVKGTIDGFGSIYVNGIRFDIDDSEIELEGVASSESDLRLGMVVTVRGTRDDDQNGTALSVEFDDDVQGPISAISVDTDGETKTLTVLGISVLVNRTSTVFDDVTFDTIAIDDVIEVSGFFNSDGSLQATRIEKKSNFVAGSSEIERKGLVSNLTATTFELGNFTVDFSSAVLSDIPGGALENGMIVEVYGTLSGTTITATKVELEDSDDGFNDDDDASVEGLISNYMDDSSFEILGVSIDASNAVLRPANLVLADGVEVEAEGRFIDGVLVATEVEARGGNIEASAIVADVDTDADTITLSFATGNLVFSVDSTTRLRDDLDTANFGLASIQVGDFVELEARQNDSTLVATKVRRADETDEDELQAPVESFIANTSVTLLGITFETTGAEFENILDMPISEAQFYDMLTVGALIKVSDDEPANGVADEVEFEDD